MRRSGPVIAALLGAPVLLFAGSASAIEVTFDQVTATAGGAAFGMVAGPLGGFVGGVLGRQLGRKLHKGPRQIDNSDLRSQAHVTPIREGRIIEPGVGVDDRAVDSTPVRMIELRPAEAEARTYQASAPSRPRGAAEARAYLASSRRHAHPARTYLASAPRPAQAADAAVMHAIPVSAVVGDSAAPGPGTLDYQLNQQKARHAEDADAVLVQKVADIR